MNKKGLQVLRIMAWARLVRIYGDEICMAWFGGILTRTDMTKPGHSVELLLFIQREAFLSEENCLQSVYRLWRAHRDFFVRRSNALGFTHSGVHLGVRNCGDPNVVFVTKYETGGSCSTWSSEAALMRAILNCESGCAYHGITDFVTNTLMKVATRLLYRRTVFTTPVCIVR